jgi:transcriptional regulator with XRE-family HTH domain
MPLPISDEVAPLVTRARLVLGITQAELGDMLGVARRTVIRWATGSVPLASQIIDLAKAVHPKDAELAAALAVSAGARLEEIGLPPLRPPAPGPLAKENAIHSIVCAAAEASVGSPQSARAGLLAALDRAAKLGVSSEELRAALRAPGGA